jgi:predicted dinucleotide-binding enzyme
MTAPISEVSAHESPIAVSILGLGYMGIAIAKTLIERGYTVSVWNRTAAKAEKLAVLGARPCSTASQCVAASSVVMFATTGSEAFKTIIDTLESSAGHGRTVIDFGTASPSQTKNSVSLAHQKSFDAYIHGSLLAVPASVGQANAKAMYSGPDAAYRSVESVLRDLGRPVYLGSSPLQAPLQESILGAFYYTLWAGYLQSVALFKRSELWSPGESMAEDLTITWLIPSLDAIHSSFIEAARQIDQGQYTSDVPGCRIANHLSSVQSYMATLQDMSVTPLAMQNLAVAIQQRISDNGGDEEISAVVNVL